MTEEKTALLERLEVTAPEHVRQVRRALERVVPPFRIGVSLRESIRVDVVRGGLAAVLEQKGSEDRRLDVVATSAEARAPRPRRSVRMSDELWMRLSKFGDPSTVAERLCEEGVERLEATR